MRVVVVTRGDLGWDCVVGVFENITVALKELEYSSVEEATRGGFIFHYQNLGK